jgi:hypothetical protein
MSSLLDSFWAPTPTYTMNESPGSCPQNPNRIFHHVLCILFSPRPNAPALGVFRKCLHANERWFFLGVYADQRKTPALRALVLFCMFRFPRRFLSKKSVPLIHCFFKNTTIIDYWKAVCAGYLLLPIISRSFYYIDTITKHGFAKIAG